MTAFKPQALHAEQIGNGRKPPIVAALGMTVEDVFRRNRLVQRQTDSSQSSVGADQFFNNRREELVALAARHAVPAIYEWREFSAAGGLISNGPTSPASIAKPAFTSERSSRAPSPPICRSSSRPGSSWSSISTPPRRSVLPSRLRSSPATTRSPSEEACSSGGGVAHAGWRGRSWLIRRLDLEANDDLDQRLGRYSELRFSVLVDKSG